MGKAIELSDSVSAFAAKHARHRGVRTRRSPRRCGQPAAVPQHRQMVAETLAKHVKLPDGTASEGRVGADLGRRRARGRHRRQAVPGRGRQCAVCVHLIRGRFPNSR